MNAPNRLAPASVRSRSVQGFLQTSLRFALGCITLATLAFSTSRAAEAVSVAAASNLVFALDELNTAFRRTEPGVTLTSLTGSSGNLVAQIANGAPIDVFLSADVDYPHALIQRGLAPADSLTIFASGRLVVWTIRENVPTSPVDRAVSASSGRIAIANVDTAPYGRAARQTLEALGLWASVQPRLVTGENITQTAQFVETGNAELGFVALSLVLSPNLKTKGTWTEVPAGLYTPLDQAAVLTRRGSANGAAARYLEFLRSDEARKILERFGYRVPPSP